MTGPQPRVAGGPGHRDRDRDAAGRPRNARPRDGLGRPLDRGAAGELAIPDDLGLSPDEAVLLAQRLIGEGRPFHAHEVLEAAWKSAPAGQRGLWKGLAQIAVGLTHARRGNSRGAVALLRRGAAAVGGFLTGTASAAHDESAGTAVPARLDAAGVRRSAIDLADRIAASGLESVAADDLLLRLTPPDEE